MGKIVKFISKALVWLLCLPILFYQRCISPFTPPIMPLHTNMLRICP